MSTPPATREPAPPAAAPLRYPGFAPLFLFWTAIGLLTSLRYQFLRPPNSPLNDIPFLLAFTACYYPWVALSPLIFRLELRFPLDLPHRLRHLALLALLSLPVCLLAAPLMAACFATVIALLQPTLQLPPSRNWLHHFPMAQALFWSSVAGGYFFRSQFQLLEHARTAARLALEKSQLQDGLKQAQLDVLRARLNPHFLFNSLQNISALTKQDPQTASRMLARLGDLLRAVLRHHAQPESSLHDELELTRAYLALEQMRFGDRLHASFLIDPDAQLASVPCFLLQPLVENAIVHGLRGIAGTGEIVISAACRNGDLLLSVADNGPGPSDDAISGQKAGVGLGSTRARLAALYPHRHSFSLQRAPSGGALVLISFPFRLSTPHAPSLPDATPQHPDR